MKSGWAIIGDLLPLPSLRSRTSEIQLYGIWRNAISSPREVWGRAPAEINFGAFLP